MRKGFVQFLVRLGVFLFIVFFVLQLVFQTLSYYFGVLPGYSVNYTYMGLFFFAVLVLFLLYNLKSIVGLKKLELDIKNVVVFSLSSAILFVGYFVLTYGLHTSVVKEKFMLVMIVSHMIYLLGVFFLMMAVFGYDFFVMFKRSIVICFLVAACFFVFTFALRSNWRIFSGMIVWVVYWILGLFFSDVNIDSSISDPLLGLNDFTIFVGSPCSGVASLSLFACIFIAVVALDWRLMNKKKLLGMFGFGLLGMYVMSILRILIIMVIGSTISGDLALSLFHTNLGWVLFVGYLMVYWYYGYRYLLSHNQTAG